MVRIVNADGTGMSRRTPIVGVVVVVVGGSRGRTAGRNNGYAARGRLIIAVGGATANG